MTELKINAESGSYPIYIEKGCIDKAAELIDLDRKVLIITDDGVPAEYTAKVAKQCKTPVIFAFIQGEASKSIGTVEAILKRMMHASMTRGDCVVAVGGGVVGDMAALAAALYMRGIDFYNIPTTLLSQLDSSIGGKCGVNCEGVKNIIGVFNQPRAVIIDPLLTDTLPDRQLFAGLAEAIKMAATCDSELFRLIESMDKDALRERSEEVIVPALRIKQRVVEQDERESGLRRVLNFGHTIGHGIEAAEGGRLHHGECIGIGMLPMCGENIKPRIRAVLDKYGLPTMCECDKEAVCAAMLHDKKSEGDGVWSVLCHSIGSCRVERLTAEQLRSMVNKSL